MKINQATVTGIVSTAAAVAAAVLPGLVDAGTISAGVASAIGAGAAALVAGYHGGKAVVALTAPSSPSVASAGTVSVLAPGAADGDPSLPVL